MNPDELKERCVSFLSDEDNAFTLRTDGVPYTFQIEALASLCREMIAEGLERADEMVLGECLGYAVDDCILNRIRKYIKAEAQRVKDDGA